MNIRRKLIVFILILVIIPTSIFALTSEMFGQRQLEKSQLSYLRTIMKAVRGEMQERRFGMQRVCTFTAEGDDLQNAIKQQDGTYLSERLQSLKRSYSYVDYAVIVDKNNQALAKLTPSSYYQSASPLYTLTKTALNGGKITFSEESFPLEQLFVENSQEYSKFLVEKQTNNLEEEPFLRQVLASVAIVPIYDKLKPQEVLGALIICDVLNNDENFPHYVSSNMTGSILTLGVDGIRVASNVPRDGDKVVIGSKFGTGEILGQNEAGDQWGNIRLNGQNYKFLDEPVLNERRENVGVIGVGVREDQFYNIIEQKTSVVLWTSLGCLGLMLVVGYFLAKKISAPIVAVTNLTKEYCASRFPGQFEAVASKDESVILQQTFEEFIRRMDIGETERKHYVKTLQQEYVTQSKLSEQLKKANEELELTVLARTAHLQNVVDELQEANNNKAKFLANMSHELRTPLNVIIGSSQVLEEGTLGDLSPKQKTYATSILNTGQYLLRLINDLLDLSKLTNGKIKLYPEDIAVDNLMNLMIIQMQKYQQEKELDFKALCVPEQLVIRGDVQKLKQIFLNLLSNAVKFTDKGGSIKITAKLEGDMVLFSVQDTGIGIAPEDKKRVFREFEQVADPYTKKTQGTGLGLAIVKRLVELQGGTVSLESEEGKGTLVSFTLPCNLENYLKTQKLGEGH